MLISSINIFITHPEARMLPLLRETRDLVRTFLKAEKFITQLGMRIGWG